jgi:large subunit ribosomal protein L25
LWRVIVDWGNAAPDNRLTAMPDYRSTWSAAVSEIRLTAETRTEFGKGGARRTRRAGKIPAVIYGHGAEPRHVSLPSREFSQAIRHGANVLLTISLDGRDEFAIAKAIQRHPIKGIYEHIDLLAVRRGEKVTIEVPLVVSGEVAPGAMANVELNNIAVEAEATNLPTEIALSVDGLESGTQIHAADLTLPDGAALVTDADILVVNITVAPTAEDREAELAESASELGIVEQKPETESTSE